MGSMRKGRWKKEGGRGKNLPLPPERQVCAEHPVHILGSQQANTMSGMAEKPPANHGITEYPRLEETRKDPGVQLLAPHRITQKSDHKDHFKSRKFVDTLLFIHLFILVSAPKPISRCCSREAVMHFI